VFAPDWPQRPVAAGGFPFCSLHTLFLTLRRPRFVSSFPASSPRDFLSYLSRSTQPQKLQDTQEPHQVLDPSSLRLSLSLSLCLSLNSSSRGRRRSCDERRGLSAFLCRRGPPLRRRTRGRGCEGDRVCCVLLSRPVARRHSIFFSQGKPHQIPSPPSPNPQHKSDDSRRDQERAALGEIDKWKSVCVEVLKPCDIDLPPVTLSLSLCLSAYLSLYSLLSLSALDRANLIIIAFVRG